MTKYEKWRELKIDPFEIKYKKIKIKSIDSYLPAGNDVVECSCLLNGEETSLFIKIARSKMAGFKTEVNHLNLIDKEKLYNKVPLIIEDGYINYKKYIVLEKIIGDRLSDILKKANNLNKKKEYLIKYGKELSLIHSIPIKGFSRAKRRVINESPLKETYQKFDSSILPYIKYLEKNNPVKDNNTFIHGDFHYANILWQKEDIIGVLDWEYSGAGFKEQDIAWACILRSTQKFMDSIDDIKAFLIGYSINGTYNKDNLKWCLINGMCHFYLMNKSNDVYKTKLMKLMSEVIEFNFI